MGIREHLPRSSAWRGKNLRTAVAAIQLEFDRAMAFLEGVVGNSRPTTSDVMARRWAEEAPYFSSTGGQSAGYLQDQLQTKWPGVFVTPLTFLDANMDGAAECGVEMCSGFPTIVGLAAGAYPMAYFYLTGTVDTRTEFEAMLAMVAHLFPAHLQAINQVTVLNEDNRAESGVAESGIEQAGV